MQASQEGVIGITLAANWFVPISNETRHQNAANRSLDFMFGWQVYEFQTYISTQLSVHLYDNNTKFIDEISMIM